MVEEEYPPKNGQMALISLSQDSESSYSNLMTNDSKNKNLFNFIFASCFSKIQEKIKVKN